MMAHQKPPPEAQESVFNIALEYLKRVNELLWRASWASMNGKYIDWFTTLQAIYREVSIKLDDNEKKAVEKKFEPLPKLLEAYEKRNKIPYKIQIQGELFQKFQEMEIELRKLLDDKKMLLPTRSDPAHALTRF